MTDINTFLSAVMERKRAKGLQVRVTYRNNVREPFNFFASSLTERDSYLTRATKLIGQPDPTGLGHVVESVEVVAA